MTQVRRIQGRRRVLAAALGVAVALAVGWSLHSPTRTTHAKTPPAAPVPEVAATTAAVPVALPPRGASQSGASPAPKTPSRVPVIDAVLVEKSSVCQGEDNLVTVRAHTDDGSDDSLYYVIGTGTGNPFPLKRWRYPEAARIPEPVVRVFGRDGAVAIAPIPTYELRDCTVSRRLDVDAVVRPNTFSEFSLTAAVRSAGAGQPPPFKAVRYVWDFGDGARETTTGNVVVHGYEDRPQSSLYSDFLVTARAVAADGAEVVGRTTLSLRNPAFEMATRGTVAIMTSLNPRFPTRDADGNVSQEVRLWHYANEEVRVTEVRVTRSYTDGRTSPAELADPSSVLGADAIPPGKDGIRTSLTLSAREDAQVSAVNYELEGTTSDGRFATTRFSVMRPPARRRITDPAFLARIAAAQQQLHTPNVTFQDLDRH